MEEQSVVHFFTFLLLLQFIIVCENEHLLHAQNSLLYIFIWKIDKDYLEIPIGNLLSLLSRTKLMHFLT